MYLMLGAGLKQYKLNIFDSIYFAFISISTIGFGDLIPGTDAFLAVLSISYILIGLALSNVIFVRLTTVLENSLFKIGASQTELNEMALDGLKQGGEFYQFDSNSTDQRLHNSASSQNTTKHLKQS